jgi:DNA-binding NarL/FixJ family response regulator
VRQGLRSILQRESDVEITGEAASGPEALQLVHFRAPNVVVIDVQLTSPSGLEIAKAIRAVCSQVRVVFVSLITNEVYVNEAVKAGANGFIAYERAQTDLVKTIRATI